jgi:uncharacterized protein YndB with AHSA1/START domain
MTRRMLRWAGAVMALPVLFLFVCLVGGALLPENHVVANRAVYSAPAEDVWRILQEIGDYPNWRLDVNEVEELPDREGHRAWREKGVSGTVTYEMVRLEPPRLLEIRVADPDLPYGGTWTLELEAVGEGCALTLTERGEVHHPIFRFMAKVFFGHHSTIDAYQRALAEELGEENTAAHVEPVQP